MKTAWLLLSSQAPGWNALQDPHPSHLEEEEEGTGKVTSSQHTNQNLG